MENKAEHDVESYAAGKGKVLMLWNAVQPLAILMLCNANAK